MSELLTDSGHTRKDLRSIESGIRKGWEIPDVLFGQLAKQMGVILAKGSNREKTAAARVLVAMNAQNNPPATPQTTINVGVKIDNGADAGRNLASQVLARIRAGELSGDVPGTAA